MKLINSLKFRFSVFTIIAVITPLIIFGFFSFALMKDIMIELSLGQVKDTLEGGYSLIKEQHIQVEAGEKTYSEAVSLVNRNLSGPLKEFRFQAKDNKELSAFLITWV